MTGVSPIRPGSLFAIPPVEVAAAKFPLLSNASAPTVPCRSCSEIKNFLPPTPPCFSASLIFCNASQRSCVKLQKRKSTVRSEEHTSELQSHSDLVCRLLLEKKKK